MPIAIFARATALPAALLAAALLALALTPGASAHARSATCTHSPAGRAHRGTRSCVAAKGHHKSRAHAHPKLVGHRTEGSPTPTNGDGHSEGGQAAEGRRTDHAGGDEMEASGPSRALCEDGNAPQPVEEGENTSEEAFVCADGSEPACAEGLAPVVSADGTQLLCEASLAEPRSSS